MRKKYEAFMNGFHARDDQNKGVRVLFEQHVFTIYSLCLSQHVDILTCICVCVCFFRSSEHSVWNYIFTKGNRQQHRRSNEIPAINCQQTTNGMAK